MKRTAILTPLLAFAAHAQAANLCEYESNTYSLGSPYCLGKPNLLLMCDVGPPIKWAYEGLDSCNRAPKGPLGHSQAATLHYPLTPSLCVYQSNTYSIGSIICTGQPNVTYQCQQGASGGFGKWKPTGDKDCNGPPPPPSKPAAPLVPGPVGNSQAATLSLPDPPDPNLCVYQSNTYSIESPICLKQGNWFYACTQGGAGGFGPWALRQTGECNDQPEGPVK
jgi:hypothetical protein